MSAQDSRPFFLNLIKIRLPITGVISIIHRVSGVFLFLSIPFFAYLLDLSLQSRAGFQQAAELLVLPIIQLAIVLLVAALVHHFFAGIRFLLTDFDIALEKSSSLKAAWLVVAAEIITLAIIALGVCT